MTLAELRTLIDVTGRLVVDQVLDAMPEDVRQRLDELGGIRWPDAPGTGLVCTLPCQTPDVQLDISFTVGGGGMLAFMVTRELFAPEVYDFARLGDAVVCAIDVAVQPLIRPRTVHRWCRRCTYGQEPLVRPQFYGPSDLPFVPLPLPGPGEIPIEDEEDEIA